MKLRVQSLALLSGLRIRHCCELWCRLQMWLWSRVAVALAQAGGYSSDSTPSLGTSICRGSGLRNSKKKTKTNKQTNKISKSREHWRSKILFLRAAEEANEIRKLSVNPTVCIQVFQNSNFCLKARFLSLATITVNCLTCFSFCFVLFFLGPHPQHMEVPRLGVESEL